MMASSDRNVTLDVHLLGRDYKVVCRDDERADLLEAVAYLDQRMREIRSASKTAGADRIIVMAALNIANELLRERKSPRDDSTPPAAEVTGTRERIQSMRAAIEQALDGQEKLF